MKKIKSARHHWWPECVSEHWKNAAGTVHWLLPDGDVRTAPPKNFGVIGNGHTIKLNSPEPSPWDQSFEQEFHEADSSFKAVISWLKNLAHDFRGDAPTLRDRFLTQPISAEQHNVLLECLVSLAARSPLFRERSVAAAEHLRGPLPEAERNAIIGLNMRRGQRVIADSFRGRGKFAILFSPHAEFIFGDGFYTTVTSISTTPLTGEMLVPLTPEVSVLYAIPAEYMTEPKLVTLELHERETRLLNDTVQVYARECLFYRNQRPEVIDAFRRREHLTYVHSDNSVGQLIRAIPGVRPIGYPW